MALPFPSLATPRDSTYMTIRFTGAANLPSLMVVRAFEGGLEQRAATRFLPNHFGADLRYLPAEFEGEIVGVSLEGLHVVDEFVVREQSGSLRRAEPDDPPASLLPMTRTFALDSRGRVTFLHGVVRSATTNDVVDHIVWGYPPATSMQRSDAPLTAPGPRHR